jgi:hypothetical protein
VCKGEREVRAAPDKNLRISTTRQCSSNGRLAAASAVMSAIRANGDVPRARIRQSNPMQISVLLVAALIVPCSILFGVVLGVLAMLVIRFELAVRAQNDLWRSVEADLKKAVASLAHKPVQWL